MANQVTQADLLELRRMNQDAVLYDDRMKFQDETESLERVSHYLSDDRQEVREVVSEKFVEQMMVDVQQAERLRTAYPELYAQAKAKEVTLREQASLSGTKKLKEDLTGRKKRAAQSRIDSMEAKRITLARSRHQEYTPFAQRRNLKEESDHVGPLSYIMHRFFNSSVEQRREAPSTSNYYSALKQQCGRAVSFAHPDGGVLAGNVFEPQNFTGKIVIVFSGSGEPGCNQRGIGLSIGAYLNKGCRVYQVDYRGYGQSGKMRPDGRYEYQRLSEKHFYDDGQTIYEAVKSLEGCSASNIVLHGYSLGGAVASRVAARAAQENTRRYGGSDRVPATEKVGGLVLDSPMVSMKYAVKACRMPGFVGDIASAGAGEYSTDDNLAVLSAHQRDIPILFAGGDSVTDHLSVRDSQIDQNHDFSNQQPTGYLSGGHFQSHIDENMISGIV